MDFAPFDTRNYRTVPVREGYAEWVATYESTVRSEMDLRLLERLAVPWRELSPAVDLACGTGRTGAWLAAAGVESIDGIDLTPEMLERARAKSIYRRLAIGDMRDTSLPAGAYRLAVEALADEHISDLAPLYAEAARLVSRGGWFVVVGYHPFFLMSGVPTHFDSRSGEPLAIESHVHLFSDHVRAARGAGWNLLQMEEMLIDAEWTARKPKWNVYLDRPISYALVWRPGP